MFKLATIFLLLFSNIILACPAPKFPNRDLEKYESIFYGQVTGVRLLEYERKMLEGLRNNFDYRIRTDTTLEYEVTVMPHKLRKGKASELETLRISGCGVIEPKVRDIGLFFVKEDGETDVLYSGESFHYEEFAELVGSHWLKQRKRLKINRGKNANK